MQMEGSLTRFYEKAKVRLPQPEHRGKMFTETGFMLALVPKRCENNSEQFSTGDNKRVPSSLCRLYRLFIRAEGMRSSS